MGPGWLETLVVSMLFVTVTWAVFRLPVWCVTPPRLAVWCAAQVRRHRAPEPPARQRRPLELIVQDARRLGPRVENPPRGTSFAKLEGWRYAYDRALAELCDALEIQHLLGVLPPGEDREKERARVESALWLAGLRIDEVA
jgi:hypothetical protein